MYEKCLAWHVIGTKSCQLKATKGSLPGTFSSVLTMTLARPLGWLRAARGKRESTAVFWLQSTKLVMETEHEAWTLTSKACLSHHNTLRVRLLLWKPSSYFWIAPFPQFLRVGSGADTDPPLHISLGAPAARVQRVSNSLCYHLRFHGTHLSRLRNRHWHITSN